MDREERYFQPDIECAEPEVLREIQSKRLREMAARCYDHVPFYRRKFDELGIKPEDIRSIDDIVKLPFTYKTDLRDHFPYGLVAVPKEEVVRVHASSGTTGKQTVVAYTQHDIDVWADGAARALAAAGCTKSDYVHVSYGYGLFTGGLGLHYGAEKLGAAAIPVSSGNTKRQVQILQDFGSNILCCTPSYAAYIGETCREMGVDTTKIPLRAGLFGAEAWSEGMRENIERLLNIDAYDIYGLSEISGPGVAMECMQKNGSHVQEDHFIPEIIDPETLEPLPFGSEGELVFTTITKTGQPLIRYRTRDLCTLTGGKCACGRTTVKMSKVKGRSDDMLIIRGVNVFPSQIEAAIMNVSAVSKHYMIYVYRINNLDVIEIDIE